MGDVAPWQWAVGTVVTLVGLYLTYRGALKTAEASKSSTNKATDQAAQDSALKAWEQLLQPYRDEVKLVRQELADERRERAEQAAADALERAEEKRKVQQKMDRLTERIDVLTIEVKHWKTMAKAIARWATTLRDQVLTLGGTVPQIPDELLIAGLLDDEPDQH
jgi:chromosome segregation ATPase